MWKYIPLKKHTIPILGTIALLKNHTTHEKSVLDFQKKKPTPNNTTNSPDIYTIISIYVLNSNPLYFKFVELKS